jgi:CRP-like cAMP-binding protein
LPSLPQHERRNRLLQALPQADYGRLAPDLQPADLPLRHVIQAADAPIDTVVFPDEGIASIVASGRDGRQIEVGLYGRDGTSAALLLLGGDHSPYEHLMQVAGHGVQVRAAAVVELFEESAAARRVFLRYAHTLTVQTAQTAFANGRCTVEQRLARWLLMCRDRLDADTVPLTHEFLGLMLGVRRSSVTVALQAFEAAGLTRGGHGQVLILDRPQMEDLAGDSYGVAEADFRRLIGGAI